MDGGDGESDGQEPGRICKKEMTEDAELHLDDALCMVRYCSMPVICTAATRGQLCKGRHLLNATPSEAQRLSRLGVYKDWGYKGPMVSLCGHVGMALPLFSP